MSGFVDVHSHVVPSGDDGARTIEEGLELCRIALEAGTEILFATPHAHAPWDTFPRTPARDELYATLARADARRGRGVGARPAARLGGVSERGPAVGAGRRSCSRGRVPCWSSSPARGSRSTTRSTSSPTAQRPVDAAGLVPVLAHPERCRAVAADPWCVRPLVEDGALLCLNAPSLVGRHGAAAERTAWALARRGAGRARRLRRPLGHASARPRHRLSRRRADAR